MYVRRLLRQQHLLVVQLHLAHVRAPLRQRHAEAAVQVHAAERRRMRVPVLDHGALPAQLGHRLQPTAHALASREAQSHARQVLELGGVPTVVVIHLVPRARLALGARINRLVHPRALARRAGHRVARVFASAPRDGLPLLRHGGRQHALRLHRLRVQRLEVAVGLPQGFVLAVLNAQQPGVPILLVPLQLAHDTLVDLGVLPHRLLKRLQLPAEIDAELALDDALDLRHGELRRDVPPRHPRQECTDILTVPLLVDAQLERLEASQPRLDLHRVAARDEEPQPRR